MHSQCGTITRLGDGIQPFLHRAVLLLFAPLAILISSLRAGLARARSSSAPFACELARTGCNAGSAPSCTMPWCWHWYLRRYAGARGAAHGSTSTRGVARRWRTRWPRIGRCGWLGTKGWRCATQLQTAAPRRSHLTPCSSIANRRPAPTHRHWIAAPARGRPGLQRWQCSIPWSSAPPWWWHLRMHLWARRRRRRCGTAKCREKVGCALLCVHCAA
mmetsp:Transcript_17770/g.40711  ORF Transcript_17770/g.40711 Transcript_17770/m.40711 type:complete len:217 (-) Transcript_17770:51-701(-)